jgi:hypothetical protein
MQRVEGGDVENPEVATYLRSDWAGDVCELVVQLVKSTAVAESEDVRSRFLVAGCASS